MVLDDGRIVVYAVKKVTPADPKETTPAQRETLARQLGQVAGSEDVDGLVRQLRQSAVVEVAEDRL